MFQAIEDFIDSYLLMCGYPLTAFNRVRARKALRRHPNLVDSSVEGRTALLDFKMGIRIPADASQPSL